MFGRTGKQILCYFDPVWKNRKTNLILFWFCLEEQENKFNIILNLKEQENKFHVILILFGRTVKNFMLFWIWKNRKTKFMLFLSCLKEQENISHVILILFRRIGKRISCYFESVWKNSKKSHVILILFGITGKQFSYYFDSVWKNRKTDFMLFWFCLKEQEKKSSHVILFGVPKTNCTFKILLQNYC
jgi:adenylate kinase family enzyme